MATLTTADQAVIQRVLNYFAGNYEKPIDENAANALSVLYAKFGFSSPISFLDALRDAPHSVLLKAVLATSGGAGTSPFVTVPAGLESQFGITTSFEITGLTKLTVNSEVLKGVLALGEVQPLLTEVDCPNLLDCASIYLQNQPVLATVSFPMFVFVSDRDYSFSGCALSQASVDHILARAVASSGYVSGTLDLSGGTSSPPSSTDPGSDYDILVNRGVMVNVNP